MSIINHQESSETDGKEDNDAEWESFSESSGSTISLSFLSSSLIANKINRMFKDIKHGKARFSDFSSCSDVSDNEKEVHEKKKTSKKTNKKQAELDMFQAEIVAKTRKALHKTFSDKLSEMESFIKSKKVSTADLITKVKNVRVKPAIPPRPWVEKYRPKTVDDIVEQTEIVAVLKQVLDGADLPHFLFYGPPGTGKTSTIIAAARELFGDVYKDRILELNASDDRGIQVIRDKVKRFAQLTASSIKPDGSPCPPYKIVILDEADSMTHAAQAALRRTMEKETKTTRFCLICNYVSSIINPLTSRCMKFRFKPLGDNVLRSRLEMICLDENVKYEPSALTAIVKTCQGDLRQAITTLQSCARLAIDNQPITENDVFEIVGVVPENLIHELLDVCKQGNFDKISNYVQKIILEAYPVTTILEQLQGIIISSEDFPDMVKSKICEKIAVVSARIQEGACDYIQIVDLCCKIAEVYNGTEK